MIADFVHLTSVLLLLLLLLLLLFYYFIIIIFFKLNYLLLLLLLLYRYVLTHVADHSFSNLGISIRIFIRKSTVFSFCHSVQVFLSQHSLSDAVMRVATMCVLFIFAY